MVDGIETLMTVIPLWGGLSGVSPRIRTSMTLVGDAVQVYNLATDDIIFTHLEP